MLSSSTINNFRLLQPEAIDLEPEHFEQARKVSSIVQDEFCQWQIYLNTLARMGFTQWLSHFLKQLGHSAGSSNNLQVLQTDTVPLTGTASLCQVGEFRFCLVTMEHVLDETVSIPQTVLNHSLLAPHFYVAIEILEEQEQMILRGFFRYDKLTQYLEQNHCQPSINDNYLLPLASFDIESNHLLFYCRYLDLNEMMQSSLSQQTASIPASGTRTPSSIDKISTFQTVRTNLSQWLAGLFEKEWCAIDDFLHPESSLALSTRNYDAGARRGRLINLGVHLKEKTVALLVNIAPEAEDRLMVLVQLHPAAGQRFLSPDFKLTLLSKAGKVLQEVAARNHDNYIQLKPFMGEAGKYFSLAISCEEASHQEDFVL
jgi:Protein of unknown function (DUF1822)